MVGRWETVQLLENCFNCWTVPRTFADYISPIEQVWQTATGTTIVVVPIWTPPQWRVWKLLMVQDCQCVTWFRHCILLVWNEGFWKSCLIYFSQYNCSLSEIIHFDFPFWFVIVICLCKYICTGVHWKAQSGLVPPWSLVLDSLIHLIDFMGSGTKSNLLSP